MIQMVKCDRPCSSQLNIFKMTSSLKSIDKVADLLNSNFDGLMMTMSNILRPDAEEPLIGELIRRLNIPVYCLGVGLQGSMAKGDMSVLSDSIRELLFALDERAALFGVRGEQTLEWLVSVGIKNAKAMGCPSMFAYPRNILAIQAPINLSRIMTAGHLKLAAQNSSRGHKLMRGFANFSPAYVFQGEIAQFKDLLDVQEVYDEATQTLDAAALNDIIRKKCKVTPPFSRYYSFGESSAWRQACTTYDVYVGDRIHGGVAALQVGKPALILYDDTRVQELASFRRIPSCSLDEFEKIGVKSAVSKYLSEDRIALFKTRYRRVLSNFEVECADAGLELFNRLTDPV